MKRFLLPVFFASALISTQCSEAQTGKGHTDIKDAATGVQGLSRLGSLPAGVRESSGLAHASEPGTYYTHGDAGNPPVLYKFNLEGKLLEKIKLPVRNRDWESLTNDNQGNLYICDCGNNNNNRKDLVVYRVNPAAPQQVKAIRFSYPDQKEFPPKKSKRNFDCEAFLWHNGKLYLFTRDRGSKSTSNVYTLPDQPGEYSAEFVTGLSLRGQVSGADLSPSGNRLAFIADQQLFLLEGSGFKAALKAKPRTIALPNAGQTEGILFLDENSLLISTEQGDLYKYQL